MRPAVSGSAPNGEPEELAIANAALRESDARHLRRALDAEQALAALARGEIDAVMLDASATPLLLRTAQEQLVKSEQLSRAIFDATPDAMLLSDETGQYVDANRAAFALSGLSKSELLGRSIAQLSVSKDEGMSALRTFREEGRVTGRLQLAVADGARRIVDYTGTSDAAPGLSLWVLRDVTARVAAEDALRRSEARFRAVIEKGSDAVSMLDRHGTTIYRSPAADHLIGRSAEEMATRSWIENIHPEDRAGVAAAVQRVVDSGGSDAALSFRAVHRDGSIRWMEGSCTNLLDDPDVGALVGSFRDTTPRRAAEEAVRESRDLLEDAQAIAHVGSWSSGVGSDGVLVWSHECYRIFGVPEGTPIGVASFFAMVHPDDREAVQSATVAARDGAFNYEVEHRAIRPDGSIRWVHERAVIELDEAGRPTSMRGTVQDVTERHLALEALTQSEARFRLLADAMPQIVWVALPDGAGLYFNQRWVEYTGLSVAESLGSRWTQPIHPEDRERTSAAWQLATSTLGPYSVECRLRRADGAYAWWLTRGVPIRDASGNVTRWFGTCTDIDDLKHAEARAIESEAMMRLTGQVARLGGWTLAVQDQRVYWSDEVCAILDFPLGTAPTLHTATELYPREYRELIVAKIARCCEDGTPFDVELQVDTARGRRIWVRALGTARYDTTGAIASVQGAFQDIDERRKLQDQFRQSQKMEAVGRLAGGVAHDFNNLLSVILSYSYLAMETLEVGDPLRQDIAQIQRAGQRATELTRQLLAFSRRQVLAARVIDLAEIVANMKPMLARLLGEDIDLTVLSNEPVGRVLADPTQVEQVLMNLAVNARDAMPGGGKLTLETINVVIEEGTSGRPVEVRPGAFVMIAVSDTGTGMLEATRARLFEPFFTTKEIGKGTGLGLATALGIVQQSGGYISVYSEVDRGTTFKVYFPRTDRAAEASVPDVSESLLGGSETILLVEDEEQVRTVACTILRKHGYTVLETSNGGEALLVSVEFGARIDLLLTDVVLPRMSGRRLAEQLAPQRPDMLVLFASGYTDDAILQHGVLNAGMAFLQKPFTPQALLSKVREVLDARGTQRAGTVR